jgi:hypothetical protein
MRKNRCYPALVALIAIFILFTVSCSGEKPDATNEYTERELISGDVDTKIDGIPITGTVPPDSLQDWPEEAKQYFEVIAKISAELRPSPDGQERQLFYDGVEFIAGSEAYAFSVFVQDRGKFENYGTYAVNATEELFYFDYEAGGFKQVTLSDTGSVTLSEEVIPE